jgi:hypothetical protein
VKAHGARAKLVAVAAPPTLGWPDDALCETARCRTPSKAARCDISTPLEDADWLDLRDAGIPMAE